MSGPEIGWAPVRLQATAADDPLLASVPGELSVLHWHGDTFELPPGGVLLASNDQYVHQAFRIGPRAWGFQFHLEVDEVAVAAFAGSFGADLAAVGTSPGDLMDSTPAELARLEVHRRPVLDRFAALVGARPLGVDDFDLAVGLT
jgi:GMP synthase-like glutamine amidotransferase